jgi:hypothetical protein
MKGRPHPMQLELRQCETMALSLPEDTARRESVTAHCNQLGLSWRLIDGVKATPGKIGCALSHLRALRLSRPGLPLLILEDDIGVTESFTPLIDIPDDADAVYLGGTIFGAIDLVDYVGFTDSVAGDEINEQLIRVYNLLSTHAILYVTDRFKAAAEAAIVHALADLDWEHDKAMAKLQETFAVYAWRRPMFYQAAALQRPEVGQRQEDVTNIVLRPRPPGIPGTLDLREGPRDCLLVREDGRLRWRWVDAEA